MYAAILRLLGLCPGLEDFEQEIADDPFCEHDTHSMGLPWFYGLPVSFSG